MKSNDSKIQHFCWSLVCFYEKMWEKFKFTFRVGVVLNSSYSLTYYPRPVSKYAIDVRVQERVNVTLACRCLITSGLARCFSVRCVEVVSIPLHMHDPSTNKSNLLPVTKFYTFLYYHLLYVLLSLLHYYYYNCKFVVRLRLIWVSCRPIHPLSIWSSWWNYSQH